MRAKKSLGQHFLKSKKAIDGIVEAAQLTPDEVVLEVGPGRGILTEALLQRVGHVIAVEKDDRLIGYLQEKFVTAIESNHLVLIHDDILQFDPLAYNLRATTYKLVANIPYYITGKFLRRFLAGDYQPSQMVLLLQKEVAERIVARDGKESLLSISVKAYGTPRYVQTVEARFFSPPPKVHSAILVVENISRAFFVDIDEDAFFRLLKTGFAHKRKKLATNLQSIASGREVLSRAFDRCGIDPSARAEDIALSQWKCLTDILSADF